MNDGAPWNLRTTKITCGFATSVGPSLGVSLRASGITISVSFYGTRAPLRGFGRSIPLGCKDHVDFAECRLAVGPVSVTTTARPDEYSPSAGFRAVSYAARSAQIVQARLLKRVLPVAPPPVVFWELGAAEYHTLNFREQTPGGSAVIRAARCIPQGTRIYAPAEYPALYENRRRAGSQYTPHWSKFSCRLFAFVDGSSSASVKYVATFRVYPIGSKEFFVVQMNEWERTEECPPGFVCG